MFNPGLFEFKNAIGQNVLLLWIYLAHDYPDPPFCNRA